MHPFDEFFSRSELVESSGRSARILPDVDLESPDGILLFRAVTLMPSALSRPVAEDYNAFARATGLEQANASARESWRLDLEEWLAGSEGWTWCGAPRRLLHVTQQFSDGAGSLGVWSCGRSWAACTWSFAVDGFTLRTPLGLVENDDAVGSTALLLASLPKSVLLLGDVSECDTSLPDHEVAMLMLASDGVDIGDIFDADRETLRALARERARGPFYGQLVVIAVVAIVGVTALIMGMLRGYDLRLGMIALFGGLWVLFDRYQKAIEEDFVARTARMPVDQLRSMLSSDETSKGLALAALVGSDETRARGWIWATRVWALLIMVLPVTLLLFVEGNASWDTPIRAIHVATFAASGGASLLYCWWRSHSFQCQECGGATVTLGKTPRREQCERCGRYWLLE